MQSSASTGEGSPVRVVTYNILSSSLASPKHFTQCKPRNLDSGNRYKKIVEKLIEEIKAGSVICLQEVSLLWAGKLESIFHKNGYHFIQTQYGNFYSGFMGVGIGFPMSMYSMEECVMMRLTDLVNWKTDPQRQNRGRPNRSLAMLPVQLLSGLVGALSQFLPFLGAKEKDEWFTAAKFRQNRIIMLKLKCLSSKRTFAIATYHMPCSPEKPKIMLMHAALAAQFMETHASDSPYLLAGDWNILPDSDPYKLLVGGKSALSLDLPSYESWKSELKNKLKSAYSEFLGGEPEFTNNAKIRDDPTFIGTLDYIFMFGDWKVESVLELPKKVSIEGPYPDDDEPSDHIMLQATLKHVP